ncbi:MAG: folylpolyglutamate synthase/dihydrofolate synthase family protein, partial [Pseudomonadota bacterium]
LGPIRALLERLGRPQDRFAPVIHVAGTNGKGSTVAFIRAMAEAAGLRVHVSTSPHLVRLNERVRLAGELIEDDYFLDCIERAKAAAEGITLSFFELTFGAACLAFAETPADLVILETGLGGLLDASNIIAKPAVAVITPIDLDHQAILGPDIATIASKKAGIIKANCPVVSAAQQEDAARILTARSLDLAAPITFLRARHYDGLPKRLGLAGIYQRDNAALAALAFKTWGHDAITYHAISEGAQKVVWPARLQHLKDGPLTRALGAGEVWLDGGHNRHAAHAVAKAIAADGKPITMLVGMMANKDHEDFFEAFRGIVSDIHTVPLTSTDYGCPPDELADKARAISEYVTAHGSLDEAVQVIGTEKPQKLLICGSLYLAGDVLWQNDEVPV